MQPRGIPTTPGSGSSRSKEDMDEDLSMTSPPRLSPLDTRRHPPAFARQSGGPPSPIRFATSINAFGLTGSPSSSSASRDLMGSGMGIDTSPPSAGTVSTRKLRRPSMLSLARSPSSSSARAEGDDHAPKTAIPPLPLLRDTSSNRPLGQAVQQPRSTTNPFATTLHPIPRWGSSATPFLTNSLIRRTSSAPPLAIEALSTHTPPVTHVDVMANGSGSNSPMDMEGEDEAAPKSPLRWAPNHLESSASRRKGKARMDDVDMTNSPDSPSLTVPPFTGRPLPAPLLATLISESSPLEHEMRSEARLQRLLSSHPQALPFTPRAPRSSRGRFPETVGDDDDDDPSDRWRSRTWGRGGSSDSDSDDMPIEDPQPESVNFAFAAGMDMDRPTSSSSSYQGQAVPSIGHQTDSNNSPVAGSQHQPTPPGQNAPWPRSSTSARISFGAAGAGMVPSPGSGLGLPNAFGGLGMGGGGTPLASPTIERLELAGSPSALSSASPGMMQYRESQGGSASVRPGKRKAAQDDRFDPYKRPRGSSPSLMNASPAMALSPSRGTPAIPIPQSPGHAPLYPSALSSSANSNSYFPTRSNRPTHPYTRPMTSRSRAASPALSIGSTSGVLSTSLGNNNGTGRPSFSLGQAFIPTGQGILPQMGAAPQGLGGLGLLSLSNSERMRREQEQGSEGGLEMMREDSEMSREAMEED